MSMFSQSRIWELSLVLLLLFDIETVALEMITFQIVEGSEISWLFVCLNMMTTPFLSDCDGYWPLPIIQDWPVLTLLEINFGITYYLSPRLG